MKYILRKHTFSPHMSVYDSDGVRRFFVKGNWFNPLRTRYLLFDDTGQALISIVQDHTVAKASYAIYENDVRLGSAGTNGLGTRGFIDIPGIGRVEMELGHGFKKSFSLAGPEGILAQVVLKRTWSLAWSIEVLKDCNPIHLIAGLAAVFGEYLRRG